MKKFNEMTKAEKRVAIAKDVLAQLKAKKYIAKTGNYVKSKVTRTPPPDLTTKDLKNCQVCAIGSCLVSAATLTGNFNKFLSFAAGRTDWDGKCDGPTVYERSNDRATILAPYFTPTQLSLMETAFERGIINDYGSNVSEAQTDAAAAMYATLGDPEARLTAIMKNIVKNKGKFVV